MINTKQLQQCIKYNINPSQVTDKQLHDLESKEVISPLKRALKQPIQKNLLNPIQDHLNLLNATTQKQLQKFLTNFQTPTSQQDYQQQYAKLVEILPTKHNLQDYIGVKQLLDILCVISVKGNDILPDLVQPLNLASKDKPENLTVFFTTALLQKLHDVEALIFSDITAQIQPQMSRETTPFQKVEDTYLTAANTQGSESCAFYSQLAILNTIASDGKLTPEQQDLLKGLQSISPLQITCQVADKGNDGKPYFLKDIKQQAIDVIQKNTSYTHLTTLKHTQTELPNLVQYFSQQNNQGTESTLFSLHMGNGHATATIYVHDNLQDLIQFTDSNIGYAQEFITGNRELPKNLFEQPRITTLTIIERMEKVLPKMADGSRIAFSPADKRYLKLLYLSLKNDTDLSNVATLDKEIDECLLTELGATLAKELGEELTKKIGATLLADSSQDNPDDITKLADQLSQLCVGKKLVSSLSAVEGIQEIVADISKGDIELQAKSAGQTLNDPNQFKAFLGKNKNLQAALLKSPEVCKKLFKLASLREKILEVKKSNEQLAQLPKVNLELLTLINEGIIQESISKESFTNLVKNLDVVKKHSVYLKAPRPLLSSLDSVKSNRIYASQILSKKNISTDTFKSQGKHLIFQILNDQPVSDKHLIADIGESFNVPTHYTKTEAQRLIARFIQVGEDINTLLATPQERRPGKNISDFIVEHATPEQHEKLLANLNLSNELKDKFSAAAEKYNKSQI